MIRDIQVGIFQHFFCFPLMCYLELNKVGYFFYPIVHGSFLFIICYFVHWFFVLKSVQVKQSTPRERTSLSMASSHAFLVAVFSRFLLISSTKQLQLYHNHVLKQLRKHLETCKIIGSMG